MAEAFITRERAEKRGLESIPGIAFLKQLGLWERAPSWLKRVQNITEAASAILKPGVKAVGYERTSNDPVPDIQGILHMELDTVLGQLKEFMEYKDSGGTEYASLSDFYLADARRCDLLDYFNILDIQNGLIKGCGAEGFRAEKDKAEPFFQYVEARIREVLTAFPDYELDHSPDTARAERTPDWHIDTGKLRRSPKRDFLNVLIGIFGKHAEFASDGKGRGRQVFKEGATTMHWGGEDGAWHRSPQGIKDRMSIAIVLRKKKRAAA